MRSVAKWSRLFLVAVGNLAIGLIVGGCGGGDGSEGGAATPSGEEIVIKTDVVIDISEGGPQPGESTGGGEVLGGSSLGDAPFCLGGTFSDRHSDDPDVGLVDRTFDCPEGSLRIGFTPGVPEGRTQAGPWSLVSGTGSFEGMHGHGDMKVEYEPGTRSSEGRETFAGTVIP